MKHLYVYLNLLGLLFFAGCGTAENQPAVERVYAVDGMTCEGCVKAIAAEAPRLKGVVSAEVNLEKETARLQVIEKAFNAEDLFARMNKMGYRFKDTEAP